MDEDMGLEVEEMRIADPTYAEDKGGCKEEEISTLNLCAIVCINLFYHHKHVIQ